MIALVSMREDAHRQDGSLLGCQLRAGIGGEFISPRLARDDGVNPR
jgi:hypothetical protein